MQTQLEHRAFLLLLTVVSVAFFWLLLPFYGAVFWAVILAIVFQPLQRNFEYRFGSRSNLAAFLSVMVCIVIAIIPMTLIVGALIREGTELVGQVQSGAIDPSSILGNLQNALPPWAQHWFDRLGIGNLELLRGRLVELLRQASQVIAARALSIGQDTLRLFVSAGIMLYVLFFLFRDGRLIARNVRSAMPLSDEYNARLTARFAAVVRATVKGNIVIAVIQGLIGGVAFWAARHQGGAALGDADDLPVAPAGGRRGAGLGAGRGLSDPDRRRHQGRGARPRRHAGDRAGRQPAAARCWSAATPGSPTTWC